MTMFLNKQNKLELIKLIDEIIEDYRLFIPYAILNEKIDLEEYKGKTKQIFNKIVQLKKINKLL